MTIEKRPGAGRYVCSVTGAALDRGAPAARHHRRGGYTPRPPAACARRDFAASRLLGLFDERGQALGLALADLQT